MHGIHLVWISGKMVEGTKRFSEWLVFVCVCVCVRARVCVCVCAIVRRKWCLDKGSPAFASTECV